MIADEPVAAGVALVCGQTGRVLLLQRALVDGDPSGGRWEFPGGKLEEGEAPLDGAVREFSEEVGVPVPPGRVDSTWISSDGVYRGYVWVTDAEESVCTEVERTVEDPDNPEQGNYTEALAWFDPGHLRGNPKMLRDEVREHTPWKLIANAGPPAAEEEDAVVVAAGDIHVNVVPHLDGEALRAGLVQGLHEEGERWSLTAAAGVPSSAFLPEDELPGPTPFHVKEDGTVDGHLALWASCHIGLPGCLKPPREESFDFYNLGEVVTADGRTVAVGKVTVGGGHAGPDLSWRTAAAHYDHSGHGVAVVHATADRWGIRLPGALVAAADEGKVDELRRSPLSGDWRRINGKLRLVAALGVNVPGYPVPRGMVASGEVQSMFVGFDTEDAAALVVEADAIRAELGLDPASRATALRAAVLG